MPQDLRFVNIKTYYTILASNMMFLFGVIELSLIYTRSLLFLVALVIVTG